ncbi:MAG: polysaccharide pyruvyl transferase family protein [Cyanobacteria bacterium J06627_28]
MDTVGLIGWNGKRNVGDDAMTAVIINYILKYVNPSANFRLLADADRLAHYTQANTEIKGFSRYNTFQSIPYVRRWLNPILFDRRLAHEAPLLLVGGGSIFHTAVHSQRLSRVIATTRQAHPNAVIASLGISIGPFQTAAQYKACKQTTSQLDFIAVRDQRSWEMLQSFELEIPSVNAMDIALLLPEVLPDMPSDARPNVGAKTDGPSVPSVAIALRHGQTPPAFIRTVTASLDALQTDNPSVVVEFLNFSDVDEPASRYVQSKLKHSERTKFYPYSDRPEEMYQRIAQSSLVLASRLHAAVIAYAVETPFGVLAYHQKCIDFAEAVNLPQPWIMPIKSLTPEALTHQLKQALIENKLPKPARALSEAKTQAHQSFQFLKAHRLPAMAK